MMTRPWNSLPPLYAALTLVIGSGLVAIGCTATPLPTPSAQGNPAVSSPTVTTPASPKLSPKPFDQLGLKAGMLYQDARNQLIRQGWQPNSKGEAPNLRDASVRELFELGYEEVKDCSGTGLGPCRFEFTNADGNLLVVSAITEGASNRERVVWRWFIEERAPSQTQSANLPFTGTRYFNFYGGNGTGESITIQPDGTTLIKRHGTVSSSVEYQGPFSNPIIFPDGTGLLIQADQIYRLASEGQIANNCKGDGQPCQSSLDEPTAAPIRDGLYILGGTDQGLEVSGDRYRYYSEGGEQEWRSLSELTSVQDGVVFDSKVYWCIPPKRALGVCTENGWKSGN